jgi:pyrroline-5-carboxylate reductase
MFKLGVIGGGVMAEAIISRLISAKIYQPAEIIISDPQLERRNYLAQQYGVAIADNNKQTTQATVALLLAIKPQIFGAIATELAEGETLSKNTVILSILAGVTLNKLETAFPHHPVIRIMPNTPATVGAGISAIASGKLVQPSHLDLTRGIFQAVGDVVEVAETLMDAVTGLSGSGPAYVAILIEALADGGVASGLPRPIAAKLALSTVLGTAQLLSESKLHPAELKDRVTSPGGTTIAGVSQLEKAGFRSALIEAVKAATQRSKELGS